MQKYICSDRYQGTRSLTDMLLSLIRLWNRCALCRLREVADFWQEGRREQRFQALITGRNAISSNCAFPNDVGASVSWYTNLLYDCTCSSTPELHFERCGDVPCNMIIIQLNQEEVPGSASSEATSPPSRESQTCLDA